MRQLSTQERKEAMSINGWAPKPSAVERNVVAVALALVVALSALLLPSPASAQAKIRIAIWDFENNAERHWWFWNDLGPAARNFIDTAFADDPSLSAKFSVIEREKLDMVLQEQGLATSGALDQQTAAKVGQVLGIKYIVTGGSSLNFPVKSPYGSPRSVKLLIPPTCLAGEARCEAPRLS